MKTLALFAVLLVGTYASSIPLMDLNLPKNVSASNVWALLVAGSNGYDNYRHQVRHGVRPRRFSPAREKCIRCHSATNLVCKVRFAGFNNASRQGEGWGGVGGVS